MGFPVIFVQYIVHAKFVKQYILNVKQFVNQ